MTPKRNSDCQSIIEAITNYKKDTSPFVVALDGGSGSGKSTISSCLERELDAVVIPCDDFFAANLPDNYWTTCSPAEKVRDVIDWRRVYKEALAPLLNGETARWYAFDFEAGPADDGTYPMQTSYTLREPQPIIVLDGIYSARPELSEWVDLAVLVDVPIETRHQRLAQREEAEFLKEWHQRWDVAEVYYFTEVRPPASFDLVVSNDQ